MFFQVQRCLDWLVENGADFPDLVIKEYDDGLRGVCAKTDIQSSKTIVRIPLKCMIMNDIAAETESGQIIVKDRRFSPNARLAIFILEEMESGQSFFKPYLDILPRKFDNFPMRWSDNELEWLKGSNIYDQTVSRRKHTKHTYNRACKLLPGFSRFPFSLFFWAKLAVSSRTFGVEVNGHDFSAMVPFADMLNHHQPSDVRWYYSDERQCFKFKSNVLIKAEQQVCVLVPFRFPV
jgi:histone-lysine N-methyltransferase SETD3